MANFESYFSDIKGLPLLTHIINMSVGKIHKKFSLLETNVDTTYLGASLKEKTIKIFRYEHYHSGTSGALVSLILFTIKYANIMKANTAHLIKLAHLLNLVK